MITLDTPIKFLREDGRATHSKKRSYPINRWMRVKGDLEVCSNGYHFTTARYWRVWMTTRIHLVEAEGDLFSQNKFCARAIRLAPRLETWTPRSAALFAADCAERVLSIFESNFPNDDRPRLAILAARGDQAAALSAARSAARSALSALSARSALSAALSAQSAALSAALSARSAARSAEIQWQDSRFLQYLNGEV